MYQLWKKLPKKFRNFVHKILHRINSSRILLRVVFFRHHLSVLKIKSLKGPVRLCLGESRDLDGWLSTNYQFFAKNFLDATKYYGSECCENIFADNVLEHLDRESGGLLVARAYDALSLGGVLRITTPDLNSIAVKYLEGAPEDVQQIAEDLVEHNLDIRLPSDLLRITYTAFGHHKGIIYDFKSLKFLLESVGFSNVTKFAPGLSSTPTLTNLESRVGKSDAWSQMAIEATKS
jgi:predicted SAM-dependent methyltransferase